jgi:hypothetical protein
MSTSLKNKKEIQQAFKETLTPSQIRKNLNLKP